MSSDKINSQIEKILRDYKNIAVVGLSEKPYRDSHAVAKFMMRQGYNVIPVNPNVESILDSKSYPNLNSIPGKVDLVDIFRNPKQVEPIIDQAIKIGAKAVWMQLGVINNDAAIKALDAGLEVVMDRCWKIEYGRTSFDKIF
jgi:predicted CoA-binding protein